MTVGEGATLLEVFDERADDDLMREVQSVGVVRIMVLEVGVRTGVAKGEQAPMRKVQRKGFRDRGCVEGIRDWLGDQCVDEGGHRIRAVRIGNRWGIHDARPDLDIVRCKSYKCAHCRMRSGAAVPV